MWKKSAKYVEYTAEMEINKESDEITTANSSELYRNGSILGKSITFKGDLIGEESLIIQGKLEGSVSLKEHSVHISDTGHVIGNIYSKVIVISGQLQGDVYASEQIVIQKTGNVCGNLIAPRITVEDGALIKGVVDMDQKTILKYSAVENHKIENLAKMFSDQDAKDSSIVSDKNLKQPQLLAKETISANHEKNKPNKEKKVLESEVK
jgi:cytoskeletal protein CcmA (bactofilin family)